MEPLWQAAGWDGVAPVTRHEARLVREPLRELRLPGVERAVLDDPWEFLEHLSDVWAAMVGQAQAAVCREVVDVAWIRREVSREGEHNRSHGGTDPVWQVVQAVPFAPKPLAARRLIRRRKREQVVRRVDQALLELLKRREALLHADASGRDLSAALRDLVRPLERDLAARGEAFDAAVRRKRQEQGLPVRSEGKVLPFRSREERAQLAAEQVPTWTRQRQQR
jgi:hypothetical protein